MYDPYAGFTMRTLPNALEVHSVFWDRPWIGVEIVVHSGGREDPVALPGLAHFVEHVVSQNIPEWEHDEARRFFETCGGHGGFGSTNYLSTRYRFAVPTDIGAFRKALAIFGSMLFLAKIKNHVERERKVIEREFNGRYLYHEKLEWEMGIRKALFRGHRLETWNRPLGRPEGFNSVTEADLQNYYDQHYVPANISLVTVGGLPIDDVIAELENSPLGIQKHGLRNQIPRPFNGMPIPEEREKIVRLSEHATFSINRTEYRATWAFPADFNRQARRVFSQILNMVLHEQIREQRGLAYSIGVDHTNYQDIGEYVITGQISPEATHSIDELVRTCITTASSRRDIFDRVLESCKRRCCMIDLSGSDLAGGSAGDLVSYQRIVTVQEDLDMLNLVRFEQMQEAAGFLNPRQQHTFITCP